MLEPHHTKEVRFAARVDGNRGFLFLNNYQDHLEMEEHKDFCIHLALEGETVTIPERGGLTLKKDVCCIFPFNLMLEGLCLKYATVQPITFMECGDETVYFFFVPEGMAGEYCFALQDILDVEGMGYSREPRDGKLFITAQEDSLIHMTCKTGRKIGLATLSKAQSMNLWQVNYRGRNRLIHTEAVVLASEEAIKLECVSGGDVQIGFFPPLEERHPFQRLIPMEGEPKGLFDNYTLPVSPMEVSFEQKKIGGSKAVIKLSAGAFSNARELMLRVNYTGDVGYAYIDGTLIHDNFCNGETWEIGLKRYEDQLADKELHLYIYPVKKGSRVHFDSAMANILEEKGEELAQIHSISILPVRQLEISGVIG